MEKLSQVYLYYEVNHEKLHCNCYIDDYLHTVFVLLQGNKYIIFLSDETASGDMSIISCNNGVVRLSLEEEYMNYPEIAEHAMSELL